MDTASGTVAAPGPGNEAPSIRSVPAWQRPVDDPVLDWIVKNPAAAASLAGLLIVIIEVLGAARYRLDVALAILAASDTAKLVVGAIVASIPLVLPAAALGFYAWSQDLEAQGRRALIVPTLAYTLGFFAFVTSPLVILAIYMGFFVIADWFPRWRSRRVGHRVRGTMEIGAHRTRFFATFAFLAVVNLTLSSVPWLPEEIITLTGGHQTVGYVLEDSGTTTTVLTLNEGIAYVPTASLVSRAVCHTGGWPIFGSVLENLGRSSGPICP